MMSKVLNILLSRRDRSFKYKLLTEIKDFKNSINQLDLRTVCNMFQQTTETGHVDTYLQTHYIK